MTLGWEHPSWDREEQAVPGLLYRLVPLLVTSGLPPHVPFGFGADVLVAEGSGSNLRAEVLPWGQAVLPAVEGRGVLGMSLLPRQIRSDLCE